ncbi:MAG TPA: hypothetical protein VF649_06770 [Sphingomonas sp.]
MPIESLTMKALMVLEETQYLVGKVTIEPSPGLRLALAFLFAVSNGDRSVFDEFWRGMLNQPCEPGPQRLLATQNANTLMNRVCLAVGVARTPALMAAGAKAAEPKLKDAAPCRGPGM